MATQFGERIRELRLKQNLLLRQLASLLDIDTSIISKIERGDRQLKREQIPKLAQILDVDVEELRTLCGENGHTDHPKTEYTDQSFSFA